MIDGDALTSAATGMRLQSERLDVIAENLANASTTGYRRRIWSAAAFGDGVRSMVAQSTAQGALRRTGVGTDLALVGQGYFSVATPQGVRYTRDGRFSRTADFSLADARGNRLLGSLGPVQFPRGARLDPDGRIYADGRFVDRIRIASFEHDLTAQDGPYLAGVAGVVPERSRATVHTGYLEDSGVDAIAEMGALVSAQRAFEADQKAVMRADETLRRAVTDVPAVRS